MRAGRRAAWKGLVLAVVGVSSVGGVLTCGSAPARAQVNLPPPPPPPLSTNNPPPPPPPSNHGGGAQGGGGSRRPHPAETHDRTAAPAPTQRNDSDVTYEVEESRKLSLRLNPLPLFLARLSVDVEYLLAPHHALVGTGQFTAKSHRSPLPSYAFGYTLNDSSGFGAEAAYHYWVKPEMQGIWFGPALVLGLTSHPIINSYAYYGLAGDVGYQAILGNGFTIGGGGGLLLIGSGAANVPAHLVPRFLFGVGWSF